MTELKYLIILLVVLFFSTQASANKYYSCMDIIPTECPFDFFIIVTEHEENSLSTKSNENIESNLLLLYKNRNIDHPKHCWEIESENCLSSLREYYELYRSGVLLPPMARKYYSADMVEFIHINIYENDKLNCSIRNFIEHTLITCMVFISMHFVTDSMVWPTMGIVLYALAWKLSSKAALWWRARKDNKVLP